MNEPENRNKSLLSQAYRSFPFRMARSRFRTIRCALRHFKRPSDIFRILWTGSVKKVTVELRSGAMISMRSSVSRHNADLTVLAENLFRDQYRLKRIARDDMVVVDIGAHIGIFAVVCASLCRNARVYSYEPECSNYALLKENARQNPALGIQPSNKAVTGTGGSEILFLSEGNSGGHSILGNKGDFQEVECTTLGDILASLPVDRIDLLKIDCEGSEYDILLSTEQKVLQRIDRIVMETHHTNSTREPDREKMQEVLRDSGFEVTILEVIYTGTDLDQLVLAELPCVKGKP